ncbi:glycoside hydrolase family 172 protein [Oerskovia flava]|uniref:glycoside hydrolase family 172 protein n=1 Tax=Oerskovia flava TaxID=2986422 RepID=UPI00223E91C3|nr:glycoside hydrolase family 172 protein [Oerskovia sp. JB1-3-2]
MTSAFPDGLRSLTRASDARTGRASSSDPTGANQDYWMVPAGESVVLAEIDGPGCITHIWMTSFCRRTLGPGVVDPVLGSRVAPVNEIHNALGVTWEEQDPFYYRKALIKITWDDQDTPSVLAPLGDFFGIGHSFPGNYESAPFNVSLKPEEAGKFGAPCARNCYFPMPFGRKARIELVNDNDVPFGVYFYIDYELYRKPLPEDTLYFHAQWTRSNPCDGWGPDLQVNSPEIQQVTNLTGDGNYVVLETEGRGHYVGCNLSVTHFQGSWWGEGDDMIYIDGESTPSVNGTGTEDYFGHAWGMQKNAFLYNGSIVHESDLPGYQVSYRFHVLDPVRFQERIKVTIEHGHANHLSDDWSSTAYWYQTLPSPQLQILPAEERLPYVAHLEPRTAPYSKPLNTEMAAARDAASARDETYRSGKDTEMARKIDLTRAAEIANIEQARRIRAAADA